MFKTDKRPQTSSEQQKETAKALNDQGNDLFKKEKFEAAIDFYTEAICLNPSMSLYHTNRALSHKRLGNWDKVIVDCEQALELDKENTKGSYLLGSALSHFGKWDAAIEIFGAGIKLIKKSPKQKAFYRELTNGLYRARKLKWQHDMPVQVDKNRQMQSRLSKVVQWSKQIQFDRLTDTEKNGREAITYEHDQLEAHILELLQEHESKYEDKVPEFLCCPVSMEIMLDPVITPSGVTYDRESIEAHFCKNGPIDPITREPLQKQQVYPNIALRQVILEYLERNPWAFES